MPEQSEQGAAFEHTLSADITASVTHPAGVVLDEQGRPVLDEHGHPVLEELQ